MALVENIKYSLSSTTNHHNANGQSTNLINQCANNINNNANSTSANNQQKKPVIFVKLTDSALKAIEDYLRIQQKTGQQASIQFLGNEGRIHIPSSSSHGPDGLQSFDFSLSNNNDIEGPQGSFECIQQCGTRSLQSMGPLPFKMRIHAKDDVYAAAKQRFSIIEDKRKQDCAKEIEQFSGDSRGKVKKKYGSGPVVRKDVSPMQNGFSQKSSSLYGSNNRSSNGYGSSYGSNFGGNGGGGRTNNLNTHTRGVLNRTSNGTMDITRRPLRERIIHMLAVKPMKKPELIVKFQREGLKDKDKRMLMTVLQQVSQLKDNVYNLSRGIWNDVQEDWPFYTEEERQAMKRRKPQNLTPPGSDCSVGSGSSGSSSSPRSTTSNPGNSPTPFKEYLSDQVMLGGKRGPNYLDAHSDDIGGDGGSLDNIPPKMRRISNFKKPNAGKTSSANTSSARNDSASPNYSRDLSGQPQRSLDSRLGHPSIVVTDVPERSSPSRLVLPSSDGSYKSPRNNFKDISHHNSSPAYNGVVVSYNQHSNKVNQNGSNQIASGQVNNPLHNSNHHSDDFTYSATAISTSSNSNVNSVSGAVDMWLHGGHNPDAEADKVRTDRFPDNVHGSQNGYSGNLTDNTTASKVFSSSSSSSTSSSTLPNYSSMDHSKENSSSSGVVKRDPSLLSNKSSSGSSARNRTSPNVQRDQSGSSGLHSSVDVDDRHKRSDRTSSAKSRPVVEPHRVKEVKDRDRNNEDRLKERNREHDAIKAGSRSEKSPSYMSKYIKIRTPDQRIRYKADFNAEYDEYLRLHAVIDKVCKKFAHLMDKLKREDKGSAAYQTVRDEITREYQQHKSNKRYVEAKARYAYLHDKLSHIKRLVTQYDAQENVDSGMADLAEVF